MDIFIEQLVRRKLKGIDLVKSLGISFGCVALFLIIAFLSMTFLPTFAFSIMFLSLIGLGYLCWWLLSGMRIEYEYSVTNGDLTVDKIIAQRKRKRVVSFDVKDVQAFKRYDPNYYTGRRFDNTLHADANDDGELWCAEFTHKTLGRTLLIFSPDERTLKAIKPFLKRQIALEAFGRNG